MSTFLQRLSDPHACLDAPSAAVIVAHPDDEVVGAGGQLSRLIGVAVAHVTDGAPRDMTDALSAGFSTREGYASGRREEAARALALAGIPPERVFRFGVVDQEACLQLGQLAVRLAQFVEDQHIDVILTHAYEGGHPDHDATAFALHAARRLIARSGVAAPEIIEMAGYHAGPAGAVTHAFLAADDPCLTVRLDARARDIKRRMLACHRSQAATLAVFGTDVERFRQAPTYNFLQPPHEGQLFYERHGWAVTGELWRAHAKAALGEPELADLEGSG